MQIITQDKQFIILNKGVEMEKLPWKISAGLWFIESEGGDRFTSRFKEGIEVKERIKFRPLRKRVWPSQRGRGADRDFNFAVAEEFKKSICLRLPLYLWRVKSQNPEYSGYKLEKYIQ